MGFLTFILVLAGFFYLNSRLKRVEDALGLRQPAQPSPPQPSIPKPPTPASLPSQPPSPPLTHTDVESFLSGNWLVKIGVLALLIGVGFFLKYAFDHWIGPIGRVAIGLTIGTILLGLGEYWQEKYSKYAQALTGGGIGVYYLSIFAAYNYYNLIGVYLTFFVFALITLTTCIMAVYYNAHSIATLGVLGGFLTPFMLGIKNLAEIETILLAYIVLLNLGILGVSLYKNWRRLSFIGFVFSYLSFGVWFADRYTPARLGFAMFVLTVFFLLFAFITIVYHLINRRSADITDLGLATLNAGMFFAVSYNLLTPRFSDFIGFFTVSLAVFYFLLAYAAFINNRDDPYLTLALSGISLVFLTLAIPIQLTRYWITLAWMAEGVVLTWLGFQFRSYKLRTFSLGVLVLVIFRLITQDINIGNLAEFTLFSNVRFFVFLISIVAFYAVFYSWWENREQLRKEDEYSLALPGLLFAANILTLIIISSEIGRFFDSRVAQLEHTTEDFSSVFEQERRQQLLIFNKQRKTLEFLKNLTTSLFWTFYAFILIIFGRLKKYQPLQLGGLILFWFVIVKVLLIDIMGERRLELAQNFSLSFVWATVAVVAVGLGIGFKYAQMRIAGLVLLWLMIFKVFLFDTWNLKELYRIGAYMTLGVILLATGYLYVRFQQRIKEILLEDKNNLSANNPAGKNLSG